MMNFFDSLCGCFSPDLKRNIIEYLSSANLNRQLIEEEKCSEDGGAPQQSIYAQVKTKSYYFMKLKEDEDSSHQNKKLPQTSEENKDNSQQPNYYPHELPQNNDTYDQIYSKKLATLRNILREEISHEYSKIYDSQDELNLKIYCKPEIYPNKRINAYRFSFDILHPDVHKVTPQSYLNISFGNNNPHEPLLEKKENVSKTDIGMDICHRFYKKILVIQQHDFYTAEKCELLQEGKSNAVYNTIFSVNGKWDKVADHSRGWVHLAGLRVSLQTTEQLQPSTSLREAENHIHFEGYINVQLDISINANMLKQPIAKEIKVYVQKLVCTLTKTDAI